MQMRGSFNWRVGTSRPSLSLSYPDPIIHKSPIVVWMRAACRGGTERQALLRQERRRKRATAAAGFACDVQRGGQECGYLGGKRKVGLMVRPRPRPPPRRCASRVGRLLDSTDERDICRAHSHRMGRESFTPAAGDRSHPFFSVLGKCPFAFT